jgi:hypothetical protein
MRKTTTIYRKNKISKINKKTEIEKNRKRADAATLPFS